MVSSAYQAELEAVCPEGWKVVPLTDVVLFQEGPGILAKDFHERGVPLIRLKGVEGDFVSLEGCNFLDPEKVASKWSHFRLKRGDLVISTSASFGRVSEVTEESEGAIPYTGLIRFRPKTKEIDAGFLRAFLGSSVFMQQVEAMASGSVIRHFGPMHLKQMALPLPTISEQHAIGKIAKLVAERLRNQSQTNETLEAMARALFKAWFVDFEPVRAKLEGRWQRGQSLPGLPAHLYDLFPDRLVDSELGEIPEGWEIGRVSNFLSLAYGKSLPAGIRNSGVIPVYGSGGITGHHDTALVDSETVIVGRKGTVGSLYWEQLPCFPIDTVFYVQPKVALPFCYHLLASLPLGDMNTDAAVPGLNRENVYRLDVISPNQTLIDNFSAIARDLRDQIFCFQNESRTLAQLRDTLLPKLISGELRIKDAEAFLKERG
jgi:type I restriction enzyme S subunit